ncbi:MAG: hypothetical protein IJN54_09620 [Lachnospiraceae bacterium]|nr:hypothetical protein [Lachnospiraceae bacterium]
MAEEDENEELVVNKAENQTVKWWTFEEDLKASTEPRLTSKNRILIGNKKGNIPDSKEKKREIVGLSNRKISD